MEEIHSLKQYLETLRVMNDYYSSNNIQDIFEEFKELFPIGTPIHDTKDIYYGKVISHDIYGNDSFVLGLKSDLGYSSFIVDLCLRRFFIGGVIKVPGDGIFNKVVMGDIKT